MEILILPYFAGVPDFSGVESAWFAARAVASRAAEGRPRGSGELVGQLFFY